MPMTDIAEALGLFGLARKPIVVGHSFGSAVALMAISLAGRIRRRPNLRSDGVAAARVSKRCGKRQYWPRVGRSQPPAPAMSRLRDCW